MSTIIPFSFEEHPVRALTIADQPWFVASDVADSLEYKVASAMTRHLDEEEKGVSIVHTPGGDQEMLIINESGLYSAILRSRKAAAKRFKKWVTAEVLPSIRRTGQYTAPCQPKAIPNTLTADQQQSIKALVKVRVEALPKGKQAKGAITCWSAIKSKFGTSYKEIAPEQFIEALSLVARVPLEGELLGPELLPTLAPLEINYTVSRWMQDSPELARHFRQTNDPHSLQVTAGMLYGMDSRSPTLSLIGQLSAAGFCVESCRVEIMALRHHLEVLTNHMTMWQSAAKSVMESGIRFKC